MYSQQLNRRHAEQQGSGRTGGDCGPGARMHHGPFHFGGEHHGHGPRGWGAWRGPRGFGGHHHRAPWERGEGEHGRGHGHAPDSAQSLRPMIGGLIALIRASEPYHAAAIQNVLNDARKRILAILAEDKPVQQSQPSEPML